MNPKRNRTYLFLLITPLILLVVTGCQAGTLPFATPPSADDAFMSSQIVGDISADTLPTDEGGALIGVQAVVATQGSRANLREGPGLEFPIVGKGTPGTTFEILGRSEDDEWWQICCTTDEVEGYESGLTTWVATSVIEIEGSADDVPASDTIFDQELFSRWDVDWSCGSSRCEVSECTASVEASVGEDTAGQWLRLDHRVLWDQSCFSTDEWLFEVNRFTGQERNGGQEDNFLYRYWVGPQAGKANKIFELSDGDRIAAECTGPHEVEVEEGEGWTTVYTGTTCHDVRTGMLLTLTYEKRWLFTGEFEGESYERAYFEDFERMEQNLVETTARLSLLDE